MTFMDGLRAAASVSFVFSWIALLIAVVPTLLVTIAAEARRWQYATIGLFGGIIGGFGGAASLFLSFWFACRGRVQQCNTAQGDMGLTITYPLGAIMGCLVALLCMRLYSGISAFQNCLYAIGSQIALWAFVIILFARLMA